MVRVDFNVVIGSWNRDRTGWLIVVMGMRSIFLEGCKEIEPCGLSYPLLSLNRIKRGSNIYA